MSECIEVPQDNVLHQLLSEFLRYAGCMSAASTEGAVDDDCYRKCGSLKIQTSIYSIPFSEILGDDGVLDDACE